jgi:predicted nucleic acid-binding protein
MEVISLDTSVLLDYYRVKDKKATMLYRLSLSYQFAISTIVVYEILRGDKKKDTFWTTFFAETRVMAFDSSSAHQSASIYQHLTTKNQMIGTNDILIAGVTLANQLRLATINRKDFIRVPNLILVD